MFFQPVGLLILLVLYLHCVTAIPQGIDIFAFLNLPNPFAAYNQRQNPPIPYIQQGPPLPYIRQTPVQQPKPGVSYLLPVHQQNKSHFYHPPSQPHLVVDYLGYWFINCTVGGQVVNPILDTGSADVWFLGPDLPQNQTNGLQVYNPKSSITALAFPGESFNISYGNGDNGVSGSVYLDTLTIGGATISKMPIGVANHYAGFYPGELGSGIIGLAFQGGNSIRPDRQPTFMEALLPTLYQPVMTTNFKMDGSGELGMGVVDHGKFNGSLTTIRANNLTTFPSSWSVENVTYASGGVDLGLFDVVFDTGGPQTTGPNATVYAYYEQIKGAVDTNGNGKGWRVPCSTAMPDLVMRFDTQGGSQLVIPGSSFLQIDNGDGTCQSWFVVEDSLVRGLPGNAFFMSHYVVFNQAEATISWALQTD